MLVAEHFLERGERLAGGEAGRGRAGDLHRAEQVEAGRDLGAGGGRDGQQRGERDHGPRGLAPHVDLADVLGPPPVVRLRLHVHAVEAPEAVEVVDVGGAHGGGHRREDVVDRHPEAPCLLAVEVDLHLRVARIERGEEAGELGALAGRGEELARLRAQLLHRERAAPVLEQHLESRGRAEPRDGGDVEGEDDGLGDLGELGPEARHDPGDVQLLAVPLVPGLESNEHGAEVRLIGGGDHAVPADRGARVDAGRLAR